MTPINVLSLFDGMSCGQLALQKANISVNTYFSSEVDKYAQFVAQKNFPNTVFLGDITKIESHTLPKIDLLIGGSPCQGFSFAGKMKGAVSKCNIEITSLNQYLDMKANGFEFEGQSYLFWEYIRLYKELKPTYFLLENVAMEQKWKNIISKELGVNPLKNADGKDGLNSALVSAQNRVRLYWTNINAQPTGFFGHLEPNIPQPKDKNIYLKHVLETNVSDKYYLSEKMLTYVRKKTDINATIDNIRKAKTLQVGGNSGGLHSQMELVVEPKVKQIGYINNKNAQANRVYDVSAKSVTLKGNAGGGGGKTGLYLYKAPCLHGFEHGSNGQFDKQLIKAGMIRRLTPIECERLQTLPDNYTQGVSNTQRYRMIGNGWTVDMIAHIFYFLVF